MENEKVTITLTVAQWQAVLNVLSHSPYIVYAPVSPIVNELQLQAAPQIDELQKKYPPPEEPAATEQ